MIPVDTMMKTWKDCKKGLAPQRTNDETGKVESKELHHKIPQRDNGPNTFDNLDPLWPDEHADKDKYRKTGRK